MSYQSATTRTMLTARLARYETMLEAAYDSMDSMANSQHITQYELDTGEGTQRVWNQDLQKLERRITWLESMIRHINDRLNGIGVCSLTMKRRY